MNEEFHHVRRKVANAILMGTTIAALSSAGCTGGTEGEGELTHQAGTSTLNDLEALAASRILFGHQSIGGNILVGLRTLADSCGCTLNIVERTGVDALRPGIYHFRAGKNGRPDLKIKDFIKAVDASVAPPDIAILKLCYSDFDGDTSPEDIARQYISAIVSLRSRLAQTRFVAATTPLTTLQTGPKAWIKLMLGRKPGGYELNAKRSRFNSVIRNYFPANEIFDIAGVESGGDISDRKPVEIPGLEALHPVLASDGSHLNSVGRRDAAIEFARVLAARSGTA